MLHNCSINKSQAIGLGVVGPRKNSNLKNESIFKSDSSNGIANPQKLRRGRNYYFAGPSTSGFDYLHIGFILAIDSLDVCLFVLKDCFLCFVFLMNKENLQF